MRTALVVIIVLSNVFQIGGLQTAKALSFPTVLSVENTAIYSDGHYSWTVFLVGDKDVLQSIDYVEYTLHPSFPNPVQMVRERGGKCAFAFSSSSWSEFNVHVKIGFKNGSETSLDHWLNLLTNKNASGCETKSRSPKRTIRKR
jgi:transcription initiation factor IIF auxiliary subunit